MRNRRFQSSVIGITALFALGASVQAGIVPIGRPQQVGSWAQSFVESGVGEFDFLAVQITSAGDTLESLDFRSYSNYDTETLYESPTLAFASGPAVGALSFDVAFNNDDSDPLSMRFAAFSGGTLVETANLEWDGSAWTISRGDWVPSRTGLLMLVPVPGAALLGIIGVAVAMLVRRRAA